MTSFNGLQWFRQLLWTAVLVAGPTILAVVVVGLVVAILQAATQVNDQAVAFAPKAVAVVVALVVTGPWMVAQLAQFTTAIFATIAGM